MALIEWRHIKVLLDKCAPGWTSELKKHHRWIKWNQKVAMLPLGSHSDRGKKRENRAEIKPGFVRKMGTILELEDCFRKNLRKIY